jgi:hypothetical protein
MGQKVGETLDKKKPQADQLLGVCLGGNGVCLQGGPTWFILLPNPLIFNNKPEIKCSNVV